MQAKIIFAKHTLRRSFDLVFGISKFLGRSNTTYGKPAQTLCQLNKICRKERYSTFHLYSKENESPMHALWDCEKIQEVWSHIFSWVDRSKTYVGSFSDLQVPVCEKPQLVEMLPLLLGFSGMKGIKPGLWKSQPHWIGQPKLQVIFFNGFIVQTHQE